MKAFAVFAGIMVAVAIMFATMGQPTYSDASGTSVGWSGGTIFDYWAAKEGERTDRIRIEQDALTQRTAIEQAAETERNRDFWQMAPYVLTALALCILAVAAGIYAWKHRPAPRVTLMLNAPSGIERFAAQLGLDDAEYMYDGQWWVVDPVTSHQYQPPPRLAQLPGPRS